MEKKKFWETGFGKFLTKAGGVVPEILDIGGKAITGNFSGAIEEVGDLLKKKAVNDEKARELFKEFELEKMKHQKELYEVEIKDRDSARDREVELAKAGGVDWLMYLTGLVGLGSFVLVVCAVIWIPSVLDNELFIHLMGMIEGVVIGNIFAYYFGTSKQ